MERNIHCVLQNILDSTLLALTCSTEHELDQLGLHEDKFPFYILTKHASNLIKWILEQHKPLKLHLR
jgi:hypothetical protein